jgi:hypothetical protein
VSFHICVKISQSVSLKNPSTKAEKAGEEVGAGPDISSFPLPPPTSGCLPQFSAFGWSVQLLGGGGKGIS